MSFDSDMFENITNSIAILIDENQEIEDFSISKLGSKMKAVDNSITHSKHKQSLPFFTVNKGDESHFSNRGLDKGSKSDYSLQILFFGDFSIPQANDNLFALPAGAKDTINNIDTYTPSDTMRKIARLSAILINEKLECNIPQIRLEKFNIFSEGYYDNESGVVGSVLNIDLYLENRGYN